MPQRNTKRLKGSTAETEAGDDDRDREKDQKIISTMRDVWKDDFSEQIEIIAQLSCKFNVIAMDTEFPGTIITRQQLRQMFNEEDLEYNCVRQNVEETKLIQVGLSLADEKGMKPSPVCTWQFHMRFDLRKQRKAADSIALLQQAGIDFERLRSEGIQHTQFAQRLMTSGLVPNKTIKWIVFHGAADFSYLLRILRDEPLPRTIEQFYKAIRIYFPMICDLKQLIREDPNLRDAGLARLAAQLGCPSIASLHQAGTDSFLTLLCYFRLKEVYESSLFGRSANCIFGLGNQRRSSFIPSFFSQQYYSNYSTMYFSNAEQCQWTHNPSTYN